MSEVSVLGTAGCDGEGAETRPRSRNRAAGRRRDRWGEPGHGTDKRAQCHLGIAVFHEVALLILHFTDEETEAQERCLV